MTTAAFPSEVKAPVHLVRSSLLLVVLLSLSANADVLKLNTGVPFIAKEIPLGRNFLNLPYGRWIWLLKTGPESTRMMLGHGRKSDRHAIWLRDFNGVEFDHSWDYAFFVYLKPDQLTVDLDKDGRQEVGIATYDDGNNVIREVMIFTVKKDRLEFVRNQGPFNLEADLSLYK